MDAGKINELFQANDNPGETAAPSVMSDGVMGNMLQITDYRSHVTARRACFRGWGLRIINGCSLNTQKM